MAKQTYHTPVGTYSLKVTAAHPLGVFQIGGLEASTVTVDDGDEVFYGDQDLSARHNFGSLKAGKTHTFTSPVWILSNSHSRVTVRDYQPQQAFDTLHVDKSPEPAVAEGEHRVVEKKKRKTKVKKQKPVVREERREERSEKPERPKREYVNPFEKPREPKPVERKVEIKGTLREGDDRR